MPSMLTPRRRVPVDAVTVVTAALLLLALVAIWGHHYPAGVDLPQHAYLFGLLTRLEAGSPQEYERLFRVEWFTPYLLSYALAYPFAKFFGALVATKVVLTVAVLGTPWAMARWLRAVGGDAAFAVLGLPLVFGFAYLWGFLSHLLAIPLVFAYLADVEVSVQRPTFKSFARCLGWGVLLFFSHGISFGLAMIIGAVRLLWTVNPRTWLRTGTHLVPLAVLSLVWLRSQKHHSTADTGSWWFTSDRIICLFSGYFVSNPQIRWAAVAAVALVAYLVLARPRLNLKPGALIPWLVACGGFLVLPESIASTWLVGTRMCVFIQAFFPALLAPRPSNGLAWIRWGPAFLAACFLVLLNVRLARFNEELAGLTEIGKHIPPGGDVFNFAPATDMASPTFGADELGQAPAWIAAEGGGLIDNGAYYYQLPVQRKSVGFPLWYPNIIAHGTAARVRQAVRRRFPDARQIAAEGGWFLYQKPEWVLGSSRIVRASQGWGQLRRDRAVSGRALRVGERSYHQGLGTHAESLIRLRVSESGTLAGACGVDREAGEDALLRFRVFDREGRAHFDSGPMRRDSVAKGFHVPVRAGDEVLLEVDPLGSKTGDHADWVDLAVQTTP